jgi:hypothetical protein
LPGGGRSCLYKNNSRHREGVAIPHETISLLLGIAHHLAHGARENQERSLQRRKINPPFPLLLYLSNLIDSRCGRYIHLLHM